MVVDGLVKASAEAIVLVRFVQQNAPVRPIKGASFEITRFNPHPRFLPVVLFVLAQYPLASPERIFTLLSSSLLDFGRKIMSSACICHEKKWHKLLLLRQYVEFFRSLSGQSSWCLPRLSSCGNRTLSAYPLTR